MKFTALVSRSLNHADESIRIQIEDEDSFTKFKDKVLEACLYCDYRSNVQMQRLFEDTSLTSTFSNSELKAATLAAQLLYPLEKLPSKSSLREDVKFEFSKLNGSGEQLTIQLKELDSYEELNTAIRHIWDLLDVRLQRTNKRELEHMAFIQQLDFNTKLKVSMVMDVLYGRATSEFVQERLKQNAEDELSKVMNEIREETSESSFREDS